jgi:hypothetical protein
LLNAKDKEIEVYLDNVLKYIKLGAIKDAYSEWNRF